MTGFNAEQYWSTRERKVWVVNLYKTIRVGKRRKEVSDIKYVGARTMQGAIDTAKYHSPLTGKVIAQARLATPHDLGADPVNFFNPQITDKDFRKSKLTGGDMSVSSATHQ